MSDLLAARLQMAVSLGFHIVFACIGMTMPWLMAAAEWRWLRTRDPVYRRLARTWARGVAVFFAVGAVSGTVLSFELGLLWPRFMRHAGPIIGLPFSWEGTAFFVEAIALGLFLYGWDRLSERVHFASGLVVGVSGVASGVLVVAANGWMNTPSGFRWVNGRALDVDPVAALFNPSWPTEALHMVIAAFVSTAFAVAGVHAARLLARPHDRLHRHALRIALALGAVAALLQPLSGDRSAKHVARTQPAKLAAMEALFHTQRGAPLLIGGIPDVRGERVRFGIEIPGALSWLAKGNRDAQVQGLDALRPDLRPPVWPCHFAFQLMVGAGSWLALFGAFALWLRVRAPERLYGRGFLRAAALSTPLGFLAVEAGWVVTEVGRQPFIVYGIMRTRDGLTPMPGVVFTLAAVSAVYLLLTAVLVLVMRHLVRASEDAADAEPGSEVGSG